MASRDPLVLQRRVGDSQRMTLNRPSAINALTHDMVRMLQRALDDAAAEPAVRTVVLDGAGDRGFCAGGDVRAVYTDVLAGGRGARAFVADEYRLNAAIAGCPKPVVALMDGVVMGGGVGLSGHASHRLVSDKSTVAMPEVRIGFCPDVGGTYLLARAPGELGTHLALTSASMTAADALLCGFADHYVPLGRRADLLDLLGSTDPLDAIGQCAAEAPPSELGNDREWIDACYAADTVGEVIERLRDTGHASVADLIVSQSPTAVEVAFRAVRLARTDVSLVETLRREFRVILRCLASPDLREGIRAQVIDKDRRPSWRPASLAEVSAADVDAYFGDLGPDELSFPGTVVTAVANRGKRQ